MVGQGNASYCGQYFTGVHKHIQNNSCGILQSSVFFLLFICSKTNAQQATRVRSSKYQSCNDTGPNSIRLAIVILTLRCTMGTPD